jgi:hypothetical protein
MRQKQEKQGCWQRTKGCLLTIFEIVVATFVIALAVSLFFAVMNRDELSSQPVSQTEDVKAEPKVTNTPRPTKTPKPTNTPKPTATPEPDTLQGWAESVANSVYGSYDPKYSDLISVTCEQMLGEDAPMIQLDVKYPDTFMRKNDDRMGGFLYDAKQANEKFANLAKEGKIAYGSVNIVAHTTYLDKYGNESDGMAASIRVKASEAAKVNWDIRNFTAEMMPGIAVSFGINPIIRDGLSLEYYSKIRY